MPTQDNRTRPATPGLTDIEVLPRQRHWGPRSARWLVALGVPTALTLLAYWVAWTNLLIGREALAILFGMPLLALLVIFPTLHMLETRRWRAIAHAAAGRSLCDLLTQAVHDPYRPTLGLWNAVRVIARCRAGRAAFGQAFRIGWRAQLVPIEPMAEPCEPRQLQAKEPLGAWTLTALFGALFVLMRLVGNPPWQQFFCGGLFLCSLLAAGWVEFGWREQWWLVPGGCVRCVPTGTSAKVQIATPACACVVMVASGDCWHVHIVTGEQGVWSLRLTRGEAEVLLAAWRSPLPPPTEEQLAELAG